jgi:pimeloyl-ACP methyl ester carboxylesterase
MRWLFFSLVLAIGCDSETVEPQPDADAGVQGEDAGPRDSSTRPDSGFPDTPDAGFSDPATILEGIEYLDDIRMYMRIRGTLTSTLPPVVFVNTGPSVGHEYQVDPMEFLLADRLLVFFDMRGTGRSGFGTLSATISNITFDSHVQDVENVVELLGTLTEAPRVDIIGHGYGAAIGAHYARRHPDRVSRLVLTAPYPANVLQHAYFRAELSARMSTADREQANIITREPECRANVQQCSIQLWNIEGPHFLCEPNEPLFSTMTFRYADFRAGFIYVERNLRDTSYDWSAEWEGITTPTTIISGPCDPIPADAAATYASRIPGSVHVIIDGTGHFPMVENPRAFQTAVKTALRYP